MTNLGITLVSRDVQRLTNFYKRALAAEPSQQEGAHFTRFEFTGSHLSIWAAEDYYQTWAQKPLGSSAICEPREAQVGSHLIEFEVAEVEAEFSRLQDNGIALVKGLTTQEWGNTSVLVSRPRRQRRQLFPKSLVTRKQDMGQARNSTILVQ